jgi:two-component system, OmpR family, alkaline phosphatase synthesis response regulator PhoP
MENSEYRILLVDDEPDILEFLSYNLLKEGYKVSQARNGKDALKLVHEILPHLVILDVMMPEMDGIETCEEIRKISHLLDTRIIFLTARGEDYSQIAGFDAGADDYITKPVKPKVLLSRIQATLRRHPVSSDKSENISQEPIAVSKNLIIDREKYIIILDGVKMDLPRKEFELLALLASKPDRVFTRDDIFHSVWGDDIIVGERTIDVHIRKLREKIGEDYIRTIKGIGYKYTS